MKDEIIIIVLAWCLYIEGMLSKEKVKWNFTDFLFCTIMIILSSLLFIIQI